MGVKCLARRNNNFIWVFYFILFPCKSLDGRIFWMNICRKFVVQISLGWDRFVIYSIFWYMLSFCFFRVFEGNKFVDKWITILKNPNVPQNPTEFQKESVAKKNSYSFPFLQGHFCFLILAITVNTNHKLYISDSKIQWTCLDPYNLLL